MKSSGTEMEPKRTKVSDAVLRQVGAQRFDRSVTRGSPGFDLRHKAKSVCLRVGVGQATYVWLTPYANFSLPSSHPQRTPGPAILENEPFEQALPNPSA
jgi:hypothetical protein